jgi:hypothetical protein
MPIVAVFLFDKTTSYTAGKNTYVIVSQILFGLDR